MLNSHLSLWRRHASTNHAKPNYEKKPRCEICPDNVTGKSAQFAVWETNTRQQQQQTLDLRNIRLATVHARLHLSSKIK